jgi:Tfp pilus assembly protein PilF
VKPGDYWKLHSQRSLLPVCGSRLANETSNLTACRINRNLADIRSLRRNANPSLTAVVCQFRLWLMVLALTLPNLTGCHALQSRTSRRSAECHALCAQARAANQAGNTAHANECLNAALRQHPSDLETRRKLAETMWNSGRQSEAVSQFTSLREQFPNDAKLASKLAVMQWETNQRLAASKTAIDALQLDPLSKEAWLIKARAEMERTELDDALVSYLRLSQVAPNDLIAMVELGELHLKRGHPDRACPLLRTALIHCDAATKSRNRMVAGNCLRQKRTLVRSDRGHGPLNRLAGFDGG